MSVTLSPVNLYIKSYPAFSSLPCLHCPSRSMCTLWHFGINWNTGTFVTRTYIEKFNSVTTTGESLLGGEWEELSFLTLYLAFRSLCTSTHAYSCSVVYSYNVCVWCTVCTVLYRNTGQHNADVHQTSNKTVCLQIFLIVYSLYCAMYSSLQMCCTDTALY